MKVNICAPARSLSRDAADRLLGLAAAEFPKLELNVLPQCFEADGHFAGSDESRAAGFLTAANDPEADAVWFARGGYGSCRLLSRVLPELGQAARRKTYIGYSDAGFLLAALAKGGFGRSVHGPMVTDILRGGGSDAARRVLRFLAGRLDPADTEAEGAFAFNLTVLAHLCATPHLPDLQGTDVLVEDVDEHLYALDRSFFSVMASGVLDRTRGLRLGRVSQIPENDIGFGEDAETMAKRWCDEFGVAYLGRADIGHDAGNKLVTFPVRSAAT